MTKLVTKLTIDIEDWADEWAHAEEEITDDDDIVRLVQSMPTGKVARMTVASRANGQTPDTVFATDKLLLYAGARAEVARKVAARYCEQEVGDHTVQVREFLGGNQDEEDQLFVLAESEEGIRRATRYILSVVPGHVFGHLKVLAAHEPKLVGQITDQLIAIIREMAKKVNE